MRLIFFFRFRQFRKKAALLFGIKFDETIFQKLKENLRIIRKNKDLVSGFFYSILKYIGVFFSIPSYQRIKGRSD